MGKLYLLLAWASGYALFERVDSEESSVQEEKKQTSEQRVDSEERSKEEEQKVLVVEPAQREQVLEKPDQPAEKGLQQRNTQKLDEQAESRPQEEKAQQVEERVPQSEETGPQDERKAVTDDDLGRFSKLIKYVAHIVFEPAAMQSPPSEGELPDRLATFLDTNLSKDKDNNDKDKDKDPDRLQQQQQQIMLGVEEPKIGSVIQEKLGFKCQSDDQISELFRGIRLHLAHLIPDLSEKDMAQVQLDRAKVKAKVNKVDAIIMQSVALLDQLDKDLNTFAMRVKEWYSWHFPELARLANNDYTVYCQLVVVIKNKENLSEKQLPQLEEILGDATKARAVLDAARLSMGTDISDLDLVNIEVFAVKVIKLAEYRKNLYAYLLSKMNACAPNVSVLIGEELGARLIAQAGGLTNLANDPALAEQSLHALKRT